LNTPYCWTYLGQAIIKAYQTENKAALYPRVILDETVLKKVRNSHAPHHTYENEIEYIKDLITEDSDGYYYIDYISKGFSQFDEPEYCPEYIEKLRSIILKNIQTNKPDILSKYGWMKNKFNIMADGLRNNASISKPESADLVELAEYYQNLKTIS